MSTGLGPCCPHPPPWFASSTGAVPIPGVIVVPDAALIFPPSMGTWCQPALLCARSDLEKSVEKIQKDLAHNHRLIPVQELEEKAVVLKQLGETLTDLKGERVAMGLHQCSTNYQNQHKSSQQLACAWHCCPFPMLSPTLCALLLFCCSCSFLHSTSQCRAAELRIWQQSLRQQEDTRTVGTRGGHRTGVAAALLSCSEIA